MVKILVTHDQEAKNDFQNFQTEKKIKMIYTVNNTDTTIYLYLPYVKWNNGITGDCIQVAIYRSMSFYEGTLLELLRNKYMKKDMNIMDWGGNIGNHTIFFAKIAEANHVWTFEPVKETFDILERNIKINNLSEKVTLYNVGLGEKETKASINERIDDNCGATSLAEDTEGDISIMAIDELCITARIDFIKVDVEGYELQALKGAEKLLRKWKPVIFIEIFQDNYIKTSNLLVDYGYKLNEIVATDNYVFIAEKDDAS